MGRAACAPAGPAGSVGSALPRRREWGGWVGGMEGAGGRGRARLQPPFHSSFLRTARGGRTGGGRAGYSASAGAGSSPGDAERPANPRRKGPRGPGPARPAGMGCMYRPARRPGPAGALTARGPRPGVRGRQRCGWRSARPPRVPRAHRGTGALRAGPRAGRAARQRRRAGARGGGADLKARMTRICGATRLPLRTRGPRGAPCPWPPTWHRQAAPPREQPAPRGVDCSAGRPALGPRPRRMGFDARSQQRTHLGLSPAACEIFSAALGRSQESVARDPSVLGSSRATGSYDADSPPPTATAAHGPCAWAQTL
jgi:hypothetical protein